MSTLGENRQPANFSSVRRLVARHPVAAFLVMAFVFGWSGFVPLLLSESGPFAVLAVPVVVSTRGRLGYESERTVPRPAETGGVAAQPSTQ